MIMLLRKSIAVPIILILIIISTGTLLVGYMININDLKAALKSREINKAEYIHNIIDYHIRSEIADLKTSSRLIKNHNELHSAAINYFISGNIAPLKKLMDDIYPILDTDIFLLTNRKGIVVYRANDPKKRGDSHARIWGFEEAISGEDIVSASKGPRGWAVRALTPISSGTKNYGVIILGKRIDDNFAKKIYDETQTHVSFGTLNGVVSSSLPPEQRRLPDNEFIKRSLLEGKTFFAEDQDNQRNIMYSPVTVVDESFGLIVETDMSPVYQLLAQNKKNLLKGYFIILLAVIMSGIMLTFYLIRPLRSLRDKSWEIIKKFSGTEPEQKKGSNEIETSVHAFNLMVETIERHLAELKTAHYEIESGQKFLQSVIDGVNDSIVVIGTGYQVKLMNSTARRFSLGDSAFGGPLYCYQINHKSNKPCDLIGEECPLSAVLKTKMPVTVIHTHTDKDGSESKFEIMASPIFDEKGEVIQIIETSRDITNRLILEDAKKKLDERIMLEQKEQSIITLAGGIAHDFNNILMGVIGNAELLQMELPFDSRYKDFTKNIIASSERMAELTKQLLAYAKTGIYQPMAVFIDSQIKEALNLIHKGKATDIDVILDLSDDLSPVFADPGQINQVLISLFNNAFEAMEKSNGKLFVQTSNVLNKAAWECQLFRHEHPAGDYVHIRISDTGPGISKGMLKRIFEPFYTTKFMGRGLGLAAAAGIIERHNGCISVDSELGKGAVFDIFLPCSKEITGEVKPEVIRSDSKPAGDTVLVADDEPQILSLLNDILAMMGYKVLKALNGTEALEIFRKEKDKVKLAILDIQMPGIDGRKLFAEMRAIKPSIKVIISTGYDEKTAIEGMGAHPPDGFIQKPYRTMALKEMIRQILKEN